MQSYKLASMIHKNRWCTERLNLIMKIQGSILVIGHYYSQRKNIQIQLKTLDLFKKISQHGNLSDQLLQQNMSSSSEKSNYFIVWSLCSVVLLHFVNKIYLPESWVKRQYSNNAIWWALQIFIACDFSFMPFKCNLSLAMYVQGAVKGINSTEGS